ncbi:hypothetical protein Scep_000032 [Stephania cephalantha]|uniref:Uncharacterized protein n=1 Tax=Stephania cephalantha TaxID=152367 RepID=A0AAP0L5L3_9MAGN
MSLHYMGHDLFMTRHVYDSPTRIATPTSSSSSLFISFMLYMGKLVLFYCYKHACMFVYRKIPFHDLHSCCNYYYMKRERKCCFHFSEVAATEKERDSRRDIKLPKKIEERKRNKYVR